MSGLTLLEVIVFLVCKGVVEDLQNETPFVLAAVRVTIAAGGSFWTVPVQHGVQRMAQEWFFVGDRFFHSIRVVDILAHGFVAQVARRGGAAHFYKTIAAFRRTERDEVFVLERPAEIGTSGAVITKTGLDR